MNDDRQVQTVQLAGSGGVSFTDNTKGIGAEFYHRGDHRYFRG